MLAMGGWCSLWNLNAALTPHVAIPYATVWIVRWIPFLVRWSRVSGRSRQHTSPDEWEEEEGSVVSALLCAERMRLRVAGVSSVGLNAALTPHVATPYATVWMLRWIPFFVPWSKV